MIRVATSLCLLAGLSLSLAACATPASTAAVDWNRPDQATDTAPVLLHDMAIANPPYPRPRYVDYLDEPTRFEFHPRNVVQDEQQDDGTDATGAADAQNAGDGSYVDNGVLYVDPNQ